jgi:branched-chain amino acid transport system substrate-binding protein
VRIINRAASAALCVAITSLLLVGLGDVSPAGAAKPPIVVGGLWSESQDTGADTGAQAAFNAFNAAGGLNGQKIKFIGMQDDQQSNTQDITATKNLINAGVTAVVPVTTGNLVGQNLLASAGIPYFGWSITSTWWGSNNGFSFTGSVAPSTAAESKVQDLSILLCKTISGGCKGKTVALLGLNNAASLESLQQFAAEWKLAGAKVVLEVSSVPQPPAVVSDFSPYVQQLLSANHGKQPDIIEQLLTPLDDVGLIGGLKNAGFSGKDYNFTLYDPRAVSLAKGSDTIITFAPWELQSPAIATMTKDVDATSSNAIHGQMTEAGYWSGMEFIAAIKRVAAKGLPITGPNITKVLNQGWTFSVPGGTGPVTFPGAHTGGGGCDSVVTSNGKAYAPALGLSCPPLIANPIAKG